MGNPRGVKRDFAALEKRRMQAARLLGKGLSQAEVARRCDVSRESVRRWFDAMQVAGREGLKKAGRAGRKPRLAASDFKLIERGLKDGPESLGFASGLWTTERVARLIFERCGVRFHPTHVGRLLRQLGWSCQRPTGRAIERDERAIQTWKKKTWPTLKKTPSGKAARSSSSTRAGSASGPIAAAPGRRVDRLRSSSTTSAGRRSR